MEKRVLFQSGWLPWVLLAPQMAVILVFFFWPAGQALLQSLQQQDAFGTSTEWVGLDNFKRLFADPGYLDSFKTTAFFSVAGRRPRHRHLAAAGRVRRPHRRAARCSTRRC